MTSNPKQKQFCRVKHFSRKRRKRIPVVVPAVWDIKEEDEEEEEEEEEEFLCRRESPRTCVIRILKEHT